MTFDSLHPSKHGAYRIGRLLAEVLEPRISRVNALLHSRADLLKQGVMRTPTKASTTASSSARIQGLIKADAATLYMASPEIRKVGA